MRALSHEQLFRSGGAGRLLAGRGSESGLGPRAWVWIGLRVPGLGPVTERAWPRSPSAVRTARARTTRAWFPRGSPSGLPRRPRSPDPARADLRIRAANLA